MTTANMGHVKEHTSQHEVATISGPLHQRSDNVQHLSCPKQLQVQGRLVLLNHDDLVRVVGWSIQGQDHGPWRRLPQCESHRLLACV